MTKAPVGSSLIVTTYNRPDALGLVLGSVLGQRQAPDEVVVADDGSGDETRRLVERFCILRHSRFPSCRSS